jgi:hypothetical protein
LGDALLLVPGDGYRTRYGLFVQLRIFAIIDVFVFIKKRQIVANDANSSIDCISTESAPD